MTALPVWCRCGNLVRFSNEDRCEECWTQDQARYGVGKPTRVKTVYIPEYQQLAAEKRSRQISALFEGHRHVRETSQAAGA